MKLVRAETGHETVEDARLRAISVSTSVISYAEARAALARAWSGGRAAAEARAALERLWPELSRIRVDDERAREAGDLADRHKLRGMDALHLAAALRFAAGSAPQPVIFASWDRDQRAAARREGLELLPAEVAMTA